ncbi:MAG: ABC transporter substrate-binding protein, partial [Acetobacteraceae bacterium]
MRRNAVTLATAAGALMIAGAAAIPARHATAAASPIKIAIPAELSGSGASVGTLWRDGVELAISDLNAKGGILGHPLVGTVYDTQTNPSVSRAVILKALDGHPYAVLGPVYSGSIQVDEPLTQKARIAEIMGGEAANLTTMGDPYIFRTSLGQAQTVPPVVDYLVKDLHAKRVGMIWVNDDYGKGGHSIFLADAKKAGLKVVADISSEAGQVSFAPDLLKLRAAHVDAVFVYLHEEENARLLKGMRQMGLKVPVVGGATLIDAQTMKLAGSDANGVVSF